MNFPPVFNNKIPLIYIHAINYTDTQREFAMKRIILSLLFNVCLICPAFCVSSIQGKCLQIGVDDCGDVECSMPDCVEHAGVKSVAASCLINEVCKCVQKCTYTCEKGYYGGGSSLFGCTVCPENASCPGASTVSGTATFTCNPGYKINALGNGCESTAQCPDGSYLHTYNGVTACATCPANGTCANDILTCDAGYYKYTGQQSPYSAYFCCPNNATCNDTGEFQYCNDGYYGNETNGCMSCPPAATCQGGELKACSDGYVCNADNGTVECYNCAVGDLCSNCKFNRCLDGYFDSEKPGETGREGHCVLCPVDGNCTGGKFIGCNSGYYGNKDGCFACPTGDGVECGDTEFTCKDDYIKTNTGCEKCGESISCSGGVCASCNKGYYGTCEKGCTKCPSLDGRAGKSSSDKSLHGNKYFNEDISGCYVTVKNENNVGDVSDLKGRLNDGVGTYYFVEETCYAK